MRPRTWLRSSIWSGSTSSFISLIVALQSDGRDAKWNVVWAECSRRWLICCGLGKVVGTRSCQRHKRSEKIRRLAMVMLGPLVMTVYKHITTSQSGERKITRLMSESVVKGAGSWYSTSWPLVSTQKCTPHHAIRILYAFRSRPDCYWRGLRGFVNKSDRRCEGTLVTPLAVVQWLNGIGSRNSQTPNNRALAWPSE